MDKFVINGGKPLSGTVTIGGAKNASLALMPATILANGIYHLHNTPDLRDILTMGRLLETMGVGVSLVDQTLTIDTKTMNSYEAPYEHVKTNAGFYLRIRSVSGKIWSGEGFTSRRLCVGTASGELAYRRYPKTWS